MLHGPCCTRPLRKVRRLPPKASVLAALIRAAGDQDDIRSFESAVSRMCQNPAENARYGAAQEVGVLVCRALAIAELSAPAAVQGAFISAGHTFDAMAAVAKVLGPATREVLVVDPYMDEKALTDFAPLAPEGVAIRLLADQKSHKSTLAPAQQRWGSQYGTKRPLEVRLAPPRMLHDRLIIVDRATVWVLTQSLNAFAARSPASIVRVDDETAALKITAYHETWDAAAPI